MSRPPCTAVCIKLHACIYTTAVRNERTKYRVQLLMLEKALVDEHQYKSGKAAVHQELKALLDRQQEMLGPNDQVRGAPCIFYFTYVRGRTPLHKHQIYYVIMSYHAIRSILHVAE